MKHLAEKLRAMQQVSQHTNDKQCNATTKKLASQKTNKQIHRVIYTSHKLIF